MSRIVSFAAHNESRKLIADSLLSRRPFNAEAEAARAANLGCAGFDAARSDGYPFRCSRTIFTVCTRTAGENLLGLLMAQSAQSVEPPSNSARFNASYCIYLVHYPLTSATFKAATALQLCGVAWGGVVFHLQVERLVIAWINARESRAGATA